MSDRTYIEAIAVLTAAIEPLDAPDKGIGYSWGMLRGQAGYYHAIRGRDELRRLRDALVKYQELAEHRRPNGSHCTHCGVEYESPARPACECAGDPPVDHDSLDYEAWLDRVRFLRFDRS